MSLNKSIISIRVKLQNRNLKKSGFNKFAGFNYFELADFLPSLNELMQEEEVNDLFTIEDEKATLTLIKGEERQSYSMPFVLFETPVNIKENKETGEIREVKSMQDIQYLGALNTYYKRYLYLNAFGITDGDVIDSMDNNTINDKKPQGTGKKATEKQIAKVKELVTNIDALLKYYEVDKLEDLTMYQASEVIAKKGK